MSLIPFDRAPLFLTTEEDRRRLPTIDVGQLARTLLIFAICVLALIVVARRSGTAPFAEHPAVQETPRS